LKETNVSLHPKTPNTRNIFNPKAWAVAFSLALTAGCAVTPKAITAQAHKAAIAADAQQLTANQAQVAGPITLDEAMARALKYNLDGRVKQLEATLADRQLAMANFALWPHLAATGGYTYRSRPYLATGLQSSVPSSSVDQNLRMGDLSFTWSLLDFGVSYYQAKQQADQALILQERRRKVTQLILTQLRQAYWQALGAQELEKTLSASLSQVDLALTNSRTIENERLKNPSEALGYQHQMLQILSELEQVRDELAQAKPRLASLMNLTPNTEFTLVKPATIKPITLTSTVESLEETALLQRPELKEAHYMTRLSTLETRKAMVRMLPGLDFKTGHNYDSNSFLIYNSWNSFASQVSWNLFNVFNYSNIKAYGQSQEELAKAQRLAMHMAVLTQVQLAFRDVQAKNHQFVRADELSNVDLRILNYSRSATQSSAEGRLTEIRANANAVIAQLRYYQSYGALQSAYGQLLTSLGEDPLPGAWPDDLSQLAQALANGEHQAAAKLGANL
jgi:outer membrane protein TolC